MKKILIFLAVMTLGLSACSSTNNGLNPKNTKGNNGNTANTQNLSTGSEPGNRQNAQTKNDTSNGRFGYVRHQRAPGANKEARDGGVAHQDLEQLADRIGRLSVRLPNVTDTSTLVTNRDVLIGYKTDSDNRKLTANQVKNTAISIVPRYFHVYVTDDSHIIPDIQRFQNLSPTHDIDNMLDDTIKEMKRSSPQGGPVEQKENQNGEDKGDQTPEKNHNK